MKLSTKLTIAAIAAGAVLTITFTALTVHSGDSREQKLVIGNADAIDTVRVTLPDIKSLHFSAQDYKGLWVYLSEEEESSDQDIISSGPYLIRCDNEAKHPYIEMDKSWAQYLRTDTTDRSKLEVWLDFSDFAPKGRGSGNLYVTVGSPIIINVPPSMVDTLSIDSDAFGVRTLYIEEMMQSHLTVYGDNYTLNFEDSKLDTLKIIGEGYDKYGTSNLRFKETLINQLHISNPSTDLNVHTLDGHIANITAEFTNEEQYMTWLLDLSQAFVGNFSWSSASPHVEVRLQTHSPYSVSLTP